MPTLSFRDFSGGLWIADETAPTTEQAGFAVPANALLQADNVELLSSGGLRGRRGSSKLNASPLAGPIVALERYYPRPDINTKIAQQPIIGNETSVGAFAWQNPAGAVFVFDPEEARVNLLGTNTSYYLFLSAPFVADPVPADATILGVTLDVLTATFVSGASIKQNSVRLFKNFVAVGSDKSTGAFLPFATTLATFGGAGDLWGTTLTPADVNVSGFGAGFSVTNPAGPADVGRVLYMRLTVTYSAPAAPRVLVAAHHAGGNIVYSSASAGVFTGITGGTLSDPLRRPRIVPWPQKGKLFLFDGVNPPQQFDGMTISPIPTDSPTGESVPVSTSPPRKGPYAALHKNRLYATEPAELAYSVYASDINRETIWRTGLHLAANDERSGVLTGLESFGDALLIFKDTALFSFVGDPEFGGQLVEFSKDGCVAPDSIAVTPFGVLFVGREGVWITDGEQVTLLSGAIRPLFVERSTQHVYANAVGVYYPRREQYWLHLSPGVDNAGYVLQRMSVSSSEGDAQRLAWVRVPGLPMNCGAAWLGSGDQGELTLGDLSGFVWTRDSGTTDAGAAVTAIAVTAQQLLDNQRRLARAYRARPLYRGAGALDLGIRYDQVTVDDVLLAPGAALGAAAFQEPREYVADKTKFGRFASIRAQSAEGPVFELHRVDLDLRFRGGRVWR